MAYVAGAATLRNIQRFLDITLLSVIDYSPSGHSPLQILLLVCTAWELSMAGYILYSIDADKFRRLIEHPAPHELKIIRKMLAERLEDLNGACDDDDPILQWNSSPAALEAIVKQRLASDNWYSDLSTAGKELWEGLIFDICTDHDEFDLGFRVENDGIYWDVINVALARLKIPPETITEKAISTFGQRPFRYCPQPSQGDARSAVDPEEQKASLQVLNQFLEEAKQDPQTILTRLAEYEGILPEHKQSLLDMLNEDDDESDDEEWPWQPMHSMHPATEVQQMVQELRSIESAIVQSSIKGVRSQYEDDLLPALERIAQSGRMLFVQVDT